MYLVLRQRHMKEAIHLEEQLARERAANLAAIRAAIADRRAQDKEKLLTAFEQVLYQISWLNVAICYTICF